LFSLLALLALLSPQTLLKQKDSTAGLNQVPSTKQIAEQLHPVLNSPSPLLCFNPP
jgi:hypothetical protein